MFDGLSGVVFLPADVMIGIRKTDIFAAHRPAQVIISINPGTLSNGPAKTQADLIQEGAANQISENVRDTQLELQQIATPDCE